MNVRVVGIGDCAVTKDPTQTLVTYALGSCIAILVHDPKAQVAGLLHYMLPESSLDKEKASVRPFVFADTGIPLLFQRAYELGAQKAQMAVVAAGGAQMLDDHGVFSIGKRNHVAMRKIFWKAGVIVQREEVGGNVSRTVSIEAGTGRVQIRTLGRSELASDDVRSSRREVLDGVQPTYRG